jgi:putative sterol carrier protein
MPKNQPSSQADVRPALQALAERLHKNRRMRKGHVIFRLSAGDNLHLDCDETSVSMRDGMPQRADRPRAELIGNGRVLKAILEGKNDPRARFLAGGFRVRGDLRYLSEVAMELGLLDRPI